MAKHLIDELCSCVHCTMIDCIFGDPLLNNWEKKFIKSVAAQGWQGDYSPKQKACIVKIFNRQKRLYTQSA